MNLDAIFPCVHYRFLLRIVFFFFAHVLISKVEFLKISFEVRTCLKILYNFVVCVFPRNVGTMRCYMHMHIA